MTPPHTLFSLCTGPMGEVRWGHTHSVWHQPAPGAPTSPTPGCRRANPTPRWVLPSPGSLPPSDLVSFLVVGSSGPGWTGAVGN